MIALLGLLLEQQHLTEANDPHDWNNDGKGSCVGYNDDTDEDKIQN